MLRRPGFRVSTPVSPTRLSCPMVRLRLRPVYAVLDPSILGGPHRRTMVEGDCSTASAFPSSGDVIEHTLTHVNIDVSREELACCQGRRGVEV